MGVTIKDIAKEANVSAMTVSRVVNNRTNGISEGKRREIQGIIERMGYRPNALARGLVTKKTNVLGLILPNIVDPFFPEIARGVQDAAIQQGYNVILCNTDDRLSEEHAAMNLLQEKCVDGILFYSSGFTTREAYLHKLLVEENDTPAALIGNHYSLIDIPSVYVDYRKALHMLADYLIGRGHRRIAYLPGMTVQPEHNQGLTGYLEALETHGIQWDPALIRRGLFTLEGARTALEELLTLAQRPSAVICENDRMALGVLEALEQRGIAVPGEISVASLDNTIVGRFITPKLTTIDVPQYEMGYQAACLLMGVIGQEPLPSAQAVELNCRLVERDSVATLP